MSATTKQKAVRVTLATKQIIDELAAHYQLPVPRLMDAALKSLLLQIDKDNGTLVLKSGEGSVAIRPLNAASNADGGEFRASAGINFMANEPREGYRIKHKKKETL